MIFDLHENETACRTLFHMKCFALRLVLKQRFKRTRKWPIVSLFEIFFSPLSNQQCVREQHWRLNFFCSRNPVFYPSFHELHSPVIVYLEALKTEFFTSKDHRANNVSVKSKLQHPSRAYPGHLTSFPAREGGNLINLVFPGAGIWSLLIGGGEFDR